MFWSFFVLQPSMYFQIDYKYLEDENMIGIGQDRRYYEVVRNNHKPQWFKTTNVYSLFFLHVHLGQRYLCV